MASQIRATTVPEIILHARVEHGHRPALKLPDPTRGFTWPYDEPLAFAGGVARWLEARGIDRGDRVVFWGPNEPAWSGAYYGCLMHGAILVPLDSRSAPDFVERVIERTRPRLQLLGAHQTPVEGV